MFFKNWFKKRKNNDDDDYKLFFDNNQDMLCIANSNGYFTKLNKKFLEKLGYSEKELYNNKFLDFIHPDDINITLESLNDLNNGKNTIVENRYKDINGKYVRLKWNAWQKDHKIYCIARDITEEYILHNKLIEYSNLLEKSENMALIGSWKWNIQTNELLWSNGLKKIYNITDVTYENYMAKTHPDDKDFLLDTINTCITEKSVFSITHKLIVDNQIKYLYAIGEYTTENDNNYIMGVAQDITKQKLSEIILIEAKIKAENASKAKSDFVANISHEIRTPINAIIGMANILTDMNLNVEEKECLYIITHSSGILLSIINNVLDFSKIEAGKMLLESTNLDIRSLLEKKKLLFGQRMLEKNLAFNIYVNDNVPRIIYTDMLKIRQVLTNLINNAIKFTDYGSISIIVIKKDNFIEFSVKDTGVGISTIVQEKLFKPFIQGDSTTTRTYGGTGLGLSICKSLVHILNGEISLKSTEGIGTTITFSIPLNEISSAKSENESENKDSSLIENKVKKVEKLIVILEDNKINQIVTKKTLEKLNFTNYKIYENGELFIKDISNLEKISLILMDLHMPKMDGYICTKKIRELGYTMPIIASTANGMTGEKEKCLNIGMNDFLLKPVQIMEFKDIINKWINY